MDDVDVLLPLKGSISSLVNVDIVATPNGDVWILYDTPLENDFVWLEYDRSDKTLVFVTEKGETRDLGMTIPDNMEQYMLKSEKAFLAHMQHGKIRTLYEIAVTVR